MAELVCGVEARTIGSLLVCRKQNVRPATDPTGEGVHPLGVGGEARDDHAAPLEQADHVPDRTHAQIPALAKLVRRLLGVIPLSIGGSTQAGRDRYASHRSTTSARSSDLGPRALRALALRRRAQAAEVGLILRDVDDFPPASKEFDWHAKGDGEPGKRRRTRLRQSGLKLADRRRRHSDCRRKIGLEQAPQPSSLGEPSRVEEQGGRPATRHRSPRPHRQSRRCSQEHRPGNRSTRSGRSMGSGSPGASRSGKSRCGRRASKMATLSCHPTTRPLPARRGAAEGGP